MSHESVLLAFGFWPLVSRFTGSRASHAPVSPFPTAAAPGLVVACLRGLARVRVRVCLCVPFVVCSCCPLLYKPSAGIR